jgi:Na+/H+ antiporter NhaD/arsenite permease-like protein
MDIIAWLGAGVFLAGYFLITLEQRFSTHKSAIALMMGSVLWIITAVAMRDHTDELKHALEATGAEIFGIVAFLLAAMALIEILVHYRLFDLIRAKLIALGAGDRQQFLLILTITFFFSAILDNIAITIAMLQIARRFFTGKNLLVAGAGIVIAANAGGAWSPIGDVTTILLWLAEKFTALEIITMAFLPSFALFCTSTALLYPKLVDGDFLKREAGDTVALSLSERLVIGTALGSFLLPLSMNIMGLPPYIGLLFGLGLTWAMIELAKHKSRHEHQSHLTANIEKILQTVDLASVKFIMGILLSVSALATLGVLAAVSTGVLGTEPSDMRMILANFGLGFFSSIVDNSSLVAMAIDIFPTNNPQLWALTAIAAGTGGSIFIIASAAGVVAMGVLKELTFQQYFKIATVPAFVGLLVAYGVWFLQYSLLWN